MDSRITKKAVEDTFATFCTASRNVGFDTSTWRLRVGDSYSAYRLYTTPGMSSHPMGEYIGRTSGEAWRYLSAAIKVLDAVEKLRGKDGRTLHSD